MKWLVPEFLNNASNVIRISNALEMNAIFYYVVIIITLATIAILFYIPNEKVPEEKQTAIITYTILIWYLLFFWIVIKNFNLISTFFKSFILIK